MHSDQIKGSYLVSLSLSLSLTFSFPLSFLKQKEFTFPRKGEVFCGLGVNWNREYDSSCFNCGVENSLKARHESMAKTIINQFIHLPKIQMGSINL